MTLKVEQNPKKLWHGMTREDTARHEKTRQATRRHGKPREYTTRHGKAREGTARHGHEGTGQEGKECFLLVMDINEKQIQYFMVKTC